MSYQDAQPHAATYSVLDGAFPPANPGSALAARLRECQQAGRAALIGYLPAGFPTVDESVAAALELVLMAGIIAVGAVPFLPVFASVVGCLAVGYGALIGTLTALVCSRLRLSVLPSMAALALVHVLVAPWLLTDVGSGTAAIRTVLGSTVTVWRDALTVPMPLSSFSGMTVLPWLTGLIVSALATRLILAGREVLAGLTTFLTMAYILFVNPTILGSTGMPKDAVFVATCVVAALGTIVMALYANYPIAVAPGMGLNAYFAYTVVGSMGYSWQAALGAVFLSGCLFLLISALGLRSARVWVCRIMVAFGVYSATPTRLFAPHFFGDFADKFQLAPLLVFGEHVAFFGGGEAALGAEAKLVDVHVLGGFSDAVDDVLLVFQFACFAGYQAEHDLLVLNKAQRFEVACAVAVVF